MNVHTSMAITIIQRITISGWSSFADKKKKKTMSGWRIGTTYIFQQNLNPKQVNIILRMFPSDCAFEPIKWFKFVFVGKIKGGAQCLKIKSFYLIKFKILEVLAN